MFDVQASANLKPPSGEISDHRLSIILSNMKQIDNLTREWLPDAGRGGQEPEKRPKQVKARSLRRVLGTGAANDSKAKAS